MRKRILLVALLLICLVPVQAQINDTTKIVLLSLNDQHAKIDNYARLKAMVDQIRQQNKYVLLFAAGDNFTGNPVVDQYPDKGFPIIDLMNTVGFNATAIGNHEFDYGQQTLKKRIEQANFPFLNANITDPSGQLGFKPYHIFSLDGNIKVCVISAIQLGSSGKPDSHPSKVTGLTFKDGVSELVKLKYLRDSCNLFIALTHLGFERDIDLADSMPQLDLIFGGHSHTLTSSPQTHHGVLIMQSGSNVSYLGKATFYLVKDSIVKVTSEMLDVAHFQDTDQAVAKKIEAFDDNDELNKVIGTFVNPVSGSDELGSLMTDAITSLESVHVAFQNNGGIRIDRLDKGPVTIKDIFKLDPFGNEVIVLNLTAKEIKSLIAGAYEKAGNSIDLQVSGLTYTVVTGKNGNLKRVDLRLPNGRKICNSKTFVTGLNSYIASSYTFDHHDPGKSLFITTAQVLINYITDQKEINYQGVKRAFVK